MSGSLYKMVKNILFSRPLYLVALEVELPRVEFPNLNIQYTGVGKINASYSTTKNIQRYKPTVIINFGSAGSLDKNIAGLVSVKDVVQRDMDVRKLGFKLGETPFEEIPDLIPLKTLTASSEQSKCKSVSCSTGDNFVTDFPELKSDIVDMELYAIARVCFLENVPLIAWKYISDNADGNSSSDWKKNVRSGTTAFKSQVIEWIKGK